MLSFLLLLQKLIFRDVFMELKRFIDGMRLRNYLFYLYPYHFTVVGIKIIFKTEGTITSPSLTQSSSSSMYHIDRA